MKIEKYEYTKKNKYNVYLDNGEVLTLYEKVITEEELLLKKEIDKELYNKLLKRNTLYDSVDLAIKYIDIRLRSKLEIKNYLLKKEVEEDIIDEIIDILLKNNYLDDDKFTKALIKDKLAFTSMGDYKIKLELQRYGVDSSIIEDNISLIDDNLLEDKMKKTIEKDLRTNKKYSGTTLKNKIYNHLVSQGYSKSKVISIINKYNF